MSKDKGASHRTIAKRPAGPQHQLGKPSKQVKTVASYGGKGKAFISGE